MTNTSLEIKSWKTICEQQQFTDPNEPELRNIILKLKPYLFKIFEECSAEDFKKIRHTLLDKKNITVKIKHIVFEFVRYCVEDTDDWNENWNDVKYKNKWLKFANCAQREKIFKAIDVLITSKKQTISQQNNIVQLEKTKEQLEKELDESKKELSLFIVEKHKLMKMIDKLKKDFDDDKHKNTELYSNHKHILENFNNLQNEYKETKNINKQLMNVIQNLSSANKHHSD